MARSPGPVRAFIYAFCMTLEVNDPLAHRALDALLAAETTVMSQLRVELDRHRLSPTGFAVMVLLTTAGGSLEMRTVRLRLKTSKANASEVVDTLERRGLVERTRIPSDRRTVSLSLTADGRELVDELFPQHTNNVHSLFAKLDEAEKRSLAQLCRKLAA